MEYIKEPLVENVIRIKNDLFEENTYIYKIDDATCLLVDPGFSFEKINNYLQHHSLTPVAILCTHGHFDHVASVKQLQSLYNCPFYMHAADMKIMQQSNFHLKIFNINERIEVAVPDVFIQDGATLAAGNKIVQFIHTPGHTPGSCLIKIDDTIFSGDTVYKNKVDIINLPGMDKKQLIKTLQNLWNSVDDDIMFYPGHGSPDLFKSIKANNQKLRMFIGLTPSDN